MIRRSFRIGLMLGVLGGAVLALLRAVQGQRQPAFQPPSTSGPWPPMPEPRPHVTAPVTPDEPVHGDVLPTARAEQTAPVVPEPEPLVPQPEPEPLHPAPAPRPPLPGEPSPGPVVPEPEPSPVVPDPQPTEPVPSPSPSPSPSGQAPPKPAARATENLQARKELAKKLAAKKLAPKKAPAPRKASRPAKAAKATAKKAAPVEEAPPRAWIEPVGGVCPDSHPIKAKLSSKLFHLPGMFAYDRTNPDRCYADEGGAESDGLRKAKR